jgi:hypothetical protein
MLKDNKMLLKSNNKPKTMMIKTMNRRMMIKEAKITKLLKITAYILARQLVKMKQLVKTKKIKVRHDLNIYQR